MKVSLVVPCHNEERNVAALYSALLEVIGDSVEYEIIFVNDGSTDGTLREIKGLRQKDRRVMFISFMKNYGHQKALMAGLRHCRHDYAISLDADLQHPPSAIPAFLGVQRQTGADVVVGQRKARQRGLLKEMLSRSFYWLFTKVTGVHVVPGASDFRLCTRRALDILCSIKEREPFLRGMIPQLGLRTAVVEYELQPRHQGAPSYTLMKSARMAVTAVLRYSDLPARLGILLGAIGIGLSAIEAVHYLFLRLFTDKLVPGQADLMVFLGLVCSTILVMLSLQLRMLSQIHDQLRQEPTYIIDETAIGN